MITWWSVSAVTERVVLLSGINGSSRDISNVATRVCSVLCSLYHRVLLFCWYIVMRVQVRQVLCSERVVSD